MGLMRVPPSKLKLGFAEKKIVELTNEVLVKNNLVQLKDIEIASLKEKAKEVLR